VVTDLRKAMKLNRHNSLLKTGRIAESLAEHQAIKLARVRSATLAQPGAAQAAWDKVGSKAALPDDNWAQ
jgi:hypothetical protein